MNHEAAGRYLMHSYIVASVPAILSLAPVGERSIRTPGSSDLRTKMRQESFEPVDTFHCHFGGMDGVSADPDPLTPRNRLKATGRVLTIIETTDTLNSVLLPPGRKKAGRPASTSRP